MASNGPYYHLQTPPSHHSHVSRSNHSDLLYNTNPIMDGRDSPDSMSNLQDNNSAHIDQNALYSRLSRALTNDDRHQFINGHATFASQQPNQIDDKLLEAVTSAADVESSLAKAGATALRDDTSSASTSGDQQQRTAEQAVSLLSPARTSTNERKRHASTQSTPKSDSPLLVKEIHVGKLVSLSPTGGSRKRRKSEEGAGEDDQNEKPAQGPSLSLLGVGESNNPSEEDSSFFVSEYPALLSSTDGRTAGICSAAALFRKPSRASKKYTRPPMSKLFSSLELSPEDFLRLQADAKAYMLDPDHAERKECVGNRGKGDTDMVKLKLYHCVKDFLEHNNIGDTFFGPQSANVETRSWVWPRDVNRVVALVTPLLRRMVTNERQRQYAIQTRKGEGSPAVPTSQRNEGTPTNTATVEKGHIFNGAEEADQPSPSPSNRLHDATIAAAKALSRALQKEHDTSPTRTHTPEDNISLRFCVVRRLSVSGQSKQEQLLSSFNLSRQDCAEYNLLFKVAAAVFDSGPNKTTAATTATSELEERLDETGLDTFNDKATSESETIRETSKTTSERPRLPGPPRIFALLPAGITLIHNDETWLDALDETFKTTWMEGQLKVIIEV